MDSAHYPRPELGSKAPQVKKIIFVLLIAMMSLTLSLSPVFAQNTETDTDVDTALTDEVDDITTTVADTGEIADPEEVGAEELEVKEPGRFSWFRNAIRIVQIAVTRDPIKKSELQLKKASFQLLKVRKWASEKPDDPLLAEKLEKMDGKYKLLIGKINTRIEKYKQEKPEEVKLKNFLINSIL